MIIKNEPGASNRMRRAGFTLIELLVVIAIIGLLSTLSVAGMNIARQKAKIVVAQNDIDQLSKAIDMLVTDCGEWPGHQIYNTVCTALPGGCPENNEICGPDANSNDCDSGLNDEAAGIWLNDSGSPYSNWSGPYITRVLTDPWGREYFFDTDYQIDVDNKPCGCGGGGCTDAVVVGSYGPDGLGVPTGGADAYGCDDIIKILKE